MQGGHSRSIQLTSTTYFYRLLYFSRFSNRIHLNIASGAVISNANADADPNTGRQLCQRHYKHPCNSNSSLGATTTNTLMLSSWEDFGQWEHCTTRSAVL